MHFLYSIGIYISSASFRVAAVFNAKARHFVNGRRGIFSKLKSAFQSEAAPLAWVHCASLGEFEQGRPIIERFKDEFPSYKILLTFFSPSGYEVRKNYALADYIFYLPWDTPDNARKFVELTKPQIAFFVKYEFWHNYIKTLEAHRIPILSVSSIFRPDQIFFKSYGGFFRRILERFNHFFVQNEKSEELLNKIGISNTSTAGDTRFDRVDQIVSQSKEIEIAQKFKNGENVFVVGSCWPEDLEVLAPHINSNAGKLKFIIAPHELKESFLVEIENALSVETVRYSEVDTNVDSADVMIIDNVGMLSALYRYGEYAYVGGAFGKGLHNILEAACYGVPIFFGNRNYLKFREAQDLIMRGGAFEVRDYADFKTKYESLINRPENYLLACEVTKGYVAENLGATKKILDHCHKLLDSK